MNPREDRVRPSLGRRLIAELLGSALLAAVVIGSGIAAAELSRADVGLQLLENAVATAVGLFALIAIFAPVSGAHFNPAVTLADALLKGTPWRDVPPYVGTQLIGCSLGAVLANLMFALPAVSISTTDRASAAHALSEVVATAGLLLTIFALVRSRRASVVPAAVGCYIAAAYWFTSSTSFANPAITIGRTLSDTFAGIAPSSVPLFVGAQLVATLLAVLLVGYLFPGADVPAGADAVPATTEVEAGTAVANVEARAEAAGPCGQGAAVPL